MGLRVMVIAVLFCIQLFYAYASSLRPNSKITVMGAVYCDICSNNTFSRHSYFLPDVNVHLSCKFKANSAGTTEQITFSVNRTTDRHGVYKLVIPSVEDIECAEEMAIESFCQASLIGRTAAASSCNVPGLKTTSDVISIKSRQANLCYYSLNALNYRPQKRDITLCGESKGMLNSLNSSKFFFPFFPPFDFPWPHFPPFPKFPFPSLPPFPYWPFPQMPDSGPPSLPFPFPQLPPLAPTPSLFSPPPPPLAFSLTDPKTWIPYISPSPPSQSQKNQNP